MAAAVRIGPYDYKVAEGWGRLPEGYRWGHVSSVAVDAQDRVYAYTRTERPLLIFDRDGNFLESWGEGVIEDAHGIWADRHGDFYVSEVLEGQRLQRFVRR